MIFLEAKDKLLKAQTDADEAIRRAKEIEAKSIPRKLTDEQRALFSNALVNAPRGELRVIAGSPEDETYAYAEQIRKLLSDSGYNTGSAPRMVRWIVTSGPINSFEVCTPSRESIPADFAPLLNAFKVINMDVSPVLRPNKENLVIIVVGKKP